MTDTLDLGRVLIKWLGHASFKIKYDKISIYIDPYDIEGAYEPADLILITHGHYDHFDKKSIDQLKKPGMLVVMPDVIAHKVPDSKGVAQVDKFEVFGIKIRTMPAYNTDKPYHPRGAGVGYILTLGNKKIYCSGDTDIIPEMKDLADQKIEVALLPIGGTYTMDEAEASEATSIIKPKTVVPMHYGKVVKADPWKFKRMVGDDAEVQILER